MQSTSGLNYRFTKKTMRKLICLLNRIRYARKYKHCDSGIEALSLAVKCGVSEGILRDIALYHVSKIEFIAEDNLVREVLEDIASFVVGGFSGDYIDNRAFELDDHIGTLDMGSKEYSCARAAYYAIWAARWEYRERESWLLVCFSYMATYVSYAYYPDGMWQWMGDGELCDTVKIFIPSLI